MHLPCQIVTKGGNLCFVNIVDIKTHGTVETDGIDVKIAIVFLYSGTGYRRSSKD
jgi:hypothetical protein